MTSIKRTRVVAALAGLLLLVTVAVGLYLGTQTRRQFTEIAGSWSGYADETEKKGAWISSLRGHLGYGGIIHTFKNYVIRKDESYRARMLDQLIQFDAVMDGYLSEPLPDAERQALQTINSTIGEYRAKLEIAERAARANWPAERTDRLVKVDDTAALLALKNLEEIWQENRLSSTRRILAAVARGETLIGIGYVAMLLLVAATAAIALLIGILFRDMRRAMTRASDELQARLKSERSEQRLAQAVEQSPATVIITDTSGNIQYVNRRFEEISGWRRDEMLGKTPRLLRSGDTSDEEYRRMWQSLGSGQPWQGFLRNLRKDGGSYWIDCTILPLRAEDGSIHSYVGIGEDITEKRIAREQVVRSQKIEAVGLMAGGIAHDFNNILTAILGSAHLAAMDAPPGSDLAGEIEQIDIAARRAQALVRQLLGFARREPGRPVATDLLTAISEVKRLIRAAIPPTVKIREVIQNEPVMVLADPTHLHQILMNLCTNAAEAIGGKEGTITLRASRLDPAPQGLRPREAGWVELDVGDDGVGMSKETLEHIFDAFYTTKPLGKGTGLGLSVVQGLVQEMAGQILVESVPGKGSRFRLHLPGAVAEKDVRQSEIRPPARGNETLLVVDDQTEVAATLRRTLTRLGYQVEAFTSPAVAVERFGRNPHRYRLLVSDVMMPEMTGMEMAKRMRVLRPELPVILCTGFNPATAPLPGRHTQILAKPVDPVELGRLVRSMLDAPAMA